MNAHANHRPTELNADWVADARAALHTTERGVDTWTASDHHTPRVDHHLSGVSYCNDCRMRLVLMEKWERMTPVQRVAALEAIEHWKVYWTAHDDTHGPDDCDAFTDIRFTVTVEHDPDASINDYDGHGKVSHAYNYTHPRHRPDGFTGRARKLQVDRGMFVWWEPYNDVIGWTDHDGIYHATKWEQWPMDCGKREYIGMIRELVSYGHHQYGVKVEYKCKCCDSWVELGEQWLCGIDSLDGDHSDVLFDDLVGQIELDL